MQEPNYEKSYFIPSFIKEDSIEITFEISNDDWYDIFISYMAPDANQKNTLILDDNCYGDAVLPIAENISTKKVCTTFIKAGKHSLKIAKGFGNININGIKISKGTETRIPEPSFELVNPDASPECKALMKFFKNIYGKKIIAGQHTNKALGPEIHYIKSRTGKLPALRGFDLLGYSLSTHTTLPTFDCIDEINNNIGSVEKAIEWNKKYNGIVSFCWHWFSPIKYRDKSFYTKNTEFDLVAGITPNTPENTALINDLDAIAEQLKKLRDANVPVLWRPLHEAEGGWFWWGTKGSQAFKKLYTLMFERFTNYHKLNNLIWVWNGFDSQWYPGDDYVDIISVDLYAPKRNYGPMKCVLEYMQSISDKKPIALGENGPIPDPDLLIESRTYWLWYMSWGGIIAADGIFTSEEQLKKVYSHPYTITLEKLPDFISYRNI